MVWKSRHNGTSRGSTAAFALVVLVLTCWPKAIGAQTPVTAGYRDFSYGTAPSATPTGEKPESKVWWNDGSWWGTLFNSNAREYRIYRFDQATQGWTDTGTAVDDRDNSKSDALWDGASNHLYIVSHVFTTTGQSASSSQWGRLYRYSYSSSQKTYSLDSGFPITITKGKSETLTIAKDSTGRLWTTFVQSSRVKVNWSVSSDTDWGDPVDLPVATAPISTKSDDISAVVAFGGANIGVIWSNQSKATSYFTYHRDTDSPTTWQAVEQVLPGTGCSGACSDDHFNLKTDQQGRLFVATKTSLTSSNQPLVMLAVRSAGASPTWTSYRFGIEHEHHTRPIVLLHEEANRLYMFATSDESGGSVYMKSSPMDNISFASGFGQAVIQSSSDTTINNVTSTKQNVNSTTGILIAASDQNTHYYLHNLLALTSAGTQPATPTGLGATAVSSTRVDLSWTDASDNEDSFSVERATGAGAFSEITTVGAGATTFSDQTAAASTSYSYRVRAHNAAGYSGYSNTATVTTPATITPPAAPSGLGATAVSSSRIDLAWTDNSANEQGFAIERATGGGAFGPIATVAADQTGFSDTTASASTTYSYRVRAYNGSVYSDYSNTATATTPAVVIPPPNAPTNLGATVVSASRVDLAWTDASGDETGFAIERAAGGGTFAQVATVGANVAAFSDTTAQGSTAYGYRVRAFNGTVYSDYSNTATATTPAVVSVPIKGMTFENGSLTDATTGADKATGSVALETVAPLKGLYSARVPNIASAYLEENFSATSDLYTSFYIRLNALPTSDARIFMVSNAGTTVGNIMLRSNGRLRLRADSTTVGVDSAPLIVGQLYRVGFRQKQGAGGDAILEAYLVAADGAFDLPFASTAAGTWTSAADRVRIGATNPAAADIAFDNVLLDGASMPGPSLQ